MTGTALPGGHASGAPVRLQDPNTTRYQDMEVLGGEFVTCKDGQLAAVPAPGLLKGKKVGLYFSAHW